MKFYKGLFLIIVFAFFGCKEKIEKETKSINGSWNSLGSGWILKIEDSSNYSFYDITSQSCIKRRTGNFEEIRNSLSLREDTLLLKKGVITYQFIKSQSSPKLCSQDITKKKANDPIYNFDVFAETVEEHYAFMNTNNINWNELYNTQKDKLNKNSSKAELFMVIEETLEKLNDNHAYLEATENVHQEIEKLNDSNDSIEEKNGLPEYGDFEVAHKVAKHHLEEEMTKDSWLLQWGKLNDSIGYIQVKAMWLYADLDIPEKLIEEKGYVDAYVETFHTLYEGDYIEKEVKGVSKIMNRAMNDLSESSAIVLDVRFNGGGQDAVSFEILSYFLPNKTQVAKQKLKYGTKQSPVIPLYVQGKPEAFTKPLYVLTSRQTGSAAEAFSIATLAMNNAYRIGTRTSGAMSTALEKELPNGWNFSISNEIFMDNDGENYENIGIPVDYKIDYPKERQAFFRSIINNLDKDKSDILNALEQINKIISKRN